MSVTDRLASVAPDAEVWPVAESLFGDRLEAASRYAGWLAGPGAVRGIIGPREAGRLWDRHLLNCALVADLVPEAAHVVDVGSGGGLPGIVLALVRPDLRVTVIDSMMRRATFLGEVVDDLALRDRVEVVRARAEETRVRADAVTSRAVGDLTSVATWSAGLARAGGLLLAVRGVTVSEELAQQGRQLQAAGWQDAEVVERTRDSVTPCRVVRATRAAVTTSADTTRMPR